MGESSVLRENLFKGTAVLVVGGTGGIGGAAATLFGRLGADVTVAGLPGPAPAGAARVVHVDIARDGELEAAIGSLPRLDVLVNCAGIIRRREEYRPEVFADVVEVNLTGTMRACVAARPQLAAARGCIAA